MKISINAPSYRRPSRVDTLKYIPCVQIWVCETEADEYEKNYPEATIIPLKKGIQGNVCRVRNHILDNDPADVICIIDDDMNHIGYHEANIRTKLKTREIMPFLEKYSLIAMDLGVKMWGINVNPDKQCYREYTPFSLSSYVGSPFTCHINSDIRYDEKLPLKEDYDLTLQHLNKYRKALRLNKFFYSVKQAEQEGGCASYRNMNREKEQLALLQKKWGTAIVKYDNNDRSHSRKKNKTFDFNPVIRAPIKGV